MTTIQTRNMALMTLLLAMAGPALAGLGTDRVGGDVRQAQAQPVTVGLGPGTLPPERAPQSASPEDSDADYRAGEALLLRAVAAAAANRADTASYEADLRQAMVKLAQCADRGGHGESLYTYLARLSLFFPDTRQPMLDMINRQWDSLPETPDKYYARDMIKTEMAQGDTRGSEADFDRARALDSDGRYAARLNRLFPGKNGGSPAAESSARAIAALADDSIGNNEYGQRLLRQARAEAKRRSRGDDNDWGAPVASLEQAALTWRLLRAEEGTTASIEDGDYLFGYSCSAQVQACGFILATGQTCEDRSEASVSLNAQGSRLTVNAVCRSRDPDAAYYELQDPEAIEDFVRRQASVTITIRSPGNALTTPVLGLRGAGASIDRARRGG